MPSSPRYVFVLGGVMSGVGKGTCVASLGAVLQAKGLRVEAMKIDPYVNVDAGTMNPVEHGEVFVTNDGDETDQDIGTYERFLGKPITKDHYMTTGRVYLSVIERERALGYGGKCVEVVPRVPEEVIRRIRQVGKSTKADFVIVEVGGTVGEYENILFLEAVRMMRLEEPDRVRSILVSYLPVPPSIGEMKTKPTQHAVREMNRAGVQPDVLVCRSQMMVDAPRREKLSRMCGVPSTRIFASENVSSIYHIPERFDAQGFGDALLACFGMRKRPSQMKDWRALTTRMARAKTPLRIGVIGKYFSTGDFLLSDAYLSVLEAIKHAAWHEGCTPQIEWLNAEHYETHPAALRELASFDGILIPGGFGARGIEGKIAAIEYVRTHNIPFLGLCYGLQCAVIECARNLAHLPKAHTTEIDPKTPHPVVHILAGQEKNVEGGTMGGTLRLGAYPCVIEKGSVAHHAYKALTVSERHRHRFEVNSAYHDTLRKAGLRLSGLSPDGTLVEIVELPKHPFFVGVQFHPEFQSSPMDPHPLFRAFAKAARERHAHSKH